MRRAKTIRVKPNKYSEDTPPFASTKDEIRRAIERNAIQRGIFLINNLTHLNFETLIRQIELIGQSYDKEFWREQASDLQIKSQALDKLDNLPTPIPYPYYFCTPELLVERPPLIKYYRNVAMLSQKVMEGMDMGTLRYELGITQLDPSMAQVLAAYFNQIVSEIVLSNTISPNRHVEMVYANVGDSLGGAWRNEIGRLAYVEIITPLVLHLHEHGYLSYIKYSLKGRFVREELEEEESASDQSSSKPGAVQRSLAGERMLHVAEVADLATTIERLKAERIVYRELGLNNGRSLMLNRQLIWLYEENDQPRQTRIGADLLSIDGNTKELWGGELKGGADPAGSDEHWKTATRAFERIRDACAKTQRPAPQLSFLATILVDRVAQEAYQMIQQGKLSSVYNLTHIADDPTKYQAFLADMTRFLGYA